MIELSHRDTNESSWVNDDRKTWNEGRERGRWEQGTGGLVTRTA